MCIDIVWIWFGIANEQISSMFDGVICPQYGNGGVLSFCIFLVNFNCMQPANYNYIIKCELKAPIFILSCVVSFHSSLNRFNFILENVK